LVTLSGVTGGLMSFGLVGLFVGPVLLAVTYTLLEAWVKRGSTDSAWGMGDG
jgi:predicted PurR-regulated permease PerM